MSSLGPKPTLKEINALKKQINWGDVSAIYRMFSSSLGDIDGILTHGFDNPYKQILNPNSWNLSVLGGSKKTDGSIQVSQKPQIALKHHFGEMGYELHCFPCLNGEPVSRGMLDNDLCPFNKWVPETMQILFRLNSFIAFSVYSFKSGDEADAALLRFAHFKVEELIDTLRESFDVITVKGYSLAKFYQEIASRNGDILSDLK